MHVTIFSPNIVGSVLSMVHITNIWGYTDNFPLFSLNEKENTMLQIQLTFQDLQTENNEVN